MWTYKKSEKKGSYKFRMYRRAIILSAPIKNATHCEFKLKGLYLLSFNYLFSGKYLTTSEEKMIANIATRAPT